MERQIRWLETLSAGPQQAGILATPLPVLCAGDVFHKWDSPHELVNFALDKLPHMVCVAGNHDLPQHRYAAVHKSAYWTLVKAHRITNVAPGQPVTIEHGPVPIRVHGFPCGTEVAPLDDPHDLYLEVALVHQYLWVPGKGYPGAPDENRAAKVRKRLRGYDAAVFGDNHKGFLLPGKSGTSTSVRCTILNCGAFYPATADEAGYVPTAGILHADGSIKRVYADTSQDKWTSEKKLSEVKVCGKSVLEFLQSLGDLGGEVIDFAEAVKRLMEREKTPPQVRRLVLSALEDIRG